MRQALFTLALLALPVAAHAQCVATPGGAGVTVLSCPSGTSVLQTDPNGVVTGQVGGQPFVGQQLGPGMIDGRLGADPYPIVGGRAAEPQALPGALPRLGGPSAPKPPPLGRTRNPGAQALPPLGDPAVAR